MSAALHGMRPAGAQHRQGRVALLARWRWVTLEQRLVEGADPSSDPLLACRATQLRAPGMRRQEALRIEHALEDQLRVYPHRVETALLGELRLAQPDLRAVAERLRGEEPVSGVGVAKVRALHLYHAQGAEGTLRRQAREALDALGEVGRPGAPQAAKR